MPNANVSGKHCEFNHDKAGLLASSLMELQQGVLIENPMSIEPRRRQNQGSTTVLYMDVRVAVPTRSQLGREGWNWTPQQAIRAIRRFLWTMVHFPHRINIDQWLSHPFRLVGSSFKTPERPLALRLVLSQWTLNLTLGFVNLLAGSALDGRASQNFCNQSDGSDRIGDANLRFTYDLKLPC